MFGLSTVETSVESRSGVSALEGHCPAGLQHAWIRLVHKHDWEEFDKGADWGGARLDYLEIPDHNSSQVSMFRTLLHEKQSENYKSFYASMLWPSSDRKPGHAGFTCCQEEKQRDQKAVTHSYILFLKHPKQVLLIVH